MKADHRAIELMQRELAHSLIHDEGLNARMIIRELAETCLWVGEYERGLRMFAALLRDDPSDIWTYNLNRSKTIAIRL